MSTPRRRAFATTLLGTGSTTFISAVQSVLLLPILINRLGSNDYGIWLATGEVLIWLQAFDLGVPNLLIERIGRAAAINDSAAIGRWMASGIAIIGTVALLLLGVAFGVAPVLFGRFQLIAAEQTFVGAFRLAALSSAILLFTNIFVALGRAIQKPRAVVVASVAGSLLGFATTLVLLLAGNGVWSIAIGAFVRAISILTGGLLLWVTTRRELSIILTLERQTMTQIWTVAPVTMVSGVAYSLTNQSESLIAAILIHPSAATLLNVTRKLLDFMRVLLDAVAISVYGPFAHLHASGFIPRAAALFRSLMAVRLLVGAVTGCLFVSINKHVVSAWISPQVYAGDGVSALLAAGLVVSGSSFLANYLFRATGAVIAGSSLQIAEAALRVPLAVALCLQFGLAGIPLGGVIGATVFLVLNTHFLKRRLSSPDQFDELYCIGASFLALALAWMGQRASYGSLIFTALSFLVTVSPLLIGSIRRSMSEPLSGSRVGTSTVHG